MATVSSKGTVKGKSAGEAVITATINGKTTRSCTVTVKKMALNATSKTIYVNKTYTLKVNGGTGDTTWSSSDKTVAKVSSSGKVTALKPGTATITAKKNGQTFKCKVTVKWPPEDGITKTKTYDLPGSYNSTSETFTLKAKTTVTITGQVKSGSNELNIRIWDSNVNTKLSLTAKQADGKVTEKVTLAAGTYTLYYYSRSEASFTFKTHTDPQIISSTKYVGRGYTLRLKTAGVVNEGTWSSSDTTIATVSSSGTVKGKKNGTCTIYCKLKDGTKISKKITVTNPVTLSVIGLDNVSIYNDCHVKFYNRTNKTIDYIDFRISQYDYKGRKLASPYSYYYYSDNIAAGKSATGLYWVHDDAETCKVSIIKVKFTDDTTWKP